jgi:hypothetical protein
VESIDYTSIFIINMKHKQNYYMYEYCTPGMVGNVHTYRGYYQVTDKLLINLLKYSCGLIPSMYNNRVFDKGSDCFWIFYFLILLKTLS